MKSKTVTGTVIVLIIIVVIALALSSSERRTESADVVEEVTNAEVVSTDEDNITNQENTMDDQTFTKDGVEVQNNIEGDGAEAKMGKMVAVHYTGRLEDGTVFDSSRQRGEPIAFTLGEGRVIAGWEIGIEGMKEGGTRTLVIPPELGYGAQGAGPIPANATLIFDVELVSVQ